MILSTEKQLGASYTLDAATKHAFPDPEIPRARGHEYALRAIEKAVQEHARTTVSRGIIESAVEVERWNEPDYLRERTILRFPAPPSTLTWAHLRFVGGRLDGQADVRAHPEDVLVEKIPPTLERLRDPGSWFLPIEELEQRATYRLAGYDLKTGQYVYHYEKASR